MPPTKKRTPELRRRILDTALQVLVTEGVGAVTTRRVAELAGTSPPAIYELFDRKEGLLRALFFEGFKRLLSTFEELPTSDDPLDDLRATVRALREFAIGNPHLFAVMYSRRFDELAPGKAERTLGDGSRRFVVARIQRCIDAGELVGDATDVAHALLGLAIGLATQENAGWLGATRASRERRWSQAADLLIAGCAPGRSNRSPKGE